MFSDEDMLIQYFGSDYGSSPWASRCLGLDRLPCASHERRIKTLFGKDNPLRRRSRSPRATRSRAVTRADGCTALRLGTYMSPAMATHPCALALLCPRLTAALLCASAIWSMFPLKAVLPRPSALLCPSPPMAAPLRASALHLLLVAMLLCALAWTCHLLIAAPPRASACAPCLRLPCGAHYRH